MANLLAYEPPDRRLSFPAINRHKKGFAGSQRGANQKAQAVAECKTGMWLNAHSRSGDVSTNEPSAEIRNQCLARQSQQDFAKHKPARRRWNVDRNHRSCINRRHCSDGKYRNGRPETSREPARCCWICCTVYSLNVYQLVFPSLITRNAWQ